MSTYESKTNNSSLHKDGETQTNSQSNLAEYVNPSVFMDVTDSFLAFTNSIPDAIVIHVEGICYSANNAALRLVGAKSLSELKGRRMLDFVAPEFQDVVADRMRKVMDRSVAPILEETLQRLDGTKIFAELYSIPITYKGKQAAFVVIRDITEQRELAQQLKDAKELAEKANLSKTEFLAKMSHELRTPLNGVMSSIELLMETSLTKEQKNKLNLALTSAEALLALINDLLDISRVEAGQLSLDCVPFDVEQLLETAIKTLDTKARKKGIALSLNYAPNTPHLIMGDPIRIWQIIANLLNNAIKFTDHGSIEVRVWAEGVTPNSLTLHVAVKDTGVGIAEDEVGQVFDTFYQSNLRKDTLIQGTGLGLAICQQLVKMMKGQLRVDSKINEGSTFTLEVTFPRPSQKEILEALNSGRFWIRGNLPSFTHLYDSNPTIPEKERLPVVEKEQPKTLVLVAEDNVINQKLLASLLKRYQCSVDLAANGKEAVEFSSQTSYDLILMDCQMPIMDGFEATTKIREDVDNASHQTIIIAVTAFAMPGDRERCLSVGMDDYICKPVRAREFSDLLKKWLPHRIKTRNQ